MSTNSMIRNAVIISGPTAVGKTAIAVEMAAQRPGIYEIISADSIQVYRRFDIGSAKPTLYERSAVLFHLIDVAEPDEDFTVVDFVDAAQSALAAIIERGRVPLIVGGSGLYIRALTGSVGIPVAGPDAAFRAELTAVAETDGVEVLHSRLTQIDPVSASRLHNRDLRRIVRALEVFHLSGRTLSSWHEEDQRNLKPAPAHYICLDRRRDDLYATVDRRIDAMFHSGLIDEVQQLRVEGISPKLKPMTSVGYRQANMFLDKVVNKESAIKLAKTATHQYARRQLIWFRKEPVTHWVDVGNETVSSIANKLNNLIVEGTWIE